MINKNGSVKQDVAIFFLIIVLGVSFFGWISGLRVFFTCCLLPSKAVTSWLAPRSPEYRFFVSLSESVPYTNKQHASGEPSSGNPMLFREIYNSYYRQLVYYAYSFVANTQQAEDLVADAFLKLWNAGNTLQSQAHAKSYLFLAVKHAAIDSLRTRQRHQDIHSLLSANTETEGLPPDFAFIESEILQEINHQVNRLPQQCATVVKLILFNGLTTAEVATEMGISAKNVLNQKALAIKKIQHALLKKGLVETFTLFLTFFSERLWN